MEESMARLGRVLTAAVIAGAAGSALVPSSVLAQGRPVQVRSDRAVPITQVARFASGTITGTVSDERGGPVPGASVTVTGAAMAMAVTDESGRFVTDLLPAGEYVLRAYRQGFSRSARSIVRIAGPQSTAPRLELRRLDAIAGTSGTAAADTVASRPIVSAGFGLPPGETRDTATDASAAEPHPHSETAWRLRHIKRSILKSESNAIIVTADNVDVEEESMFGRAIGGAANVAGYATSLFSDLSLSGEVNLLTSSAFAPGELFSADGLPRGIAYFSIGAPTPAGEWTMRAAMSEGDLASWVISGSFASRPGPSHTYVVGLSYSAQDYQGGNPVALAAMRDESRNAGEIFVFDRWRVSPWLEVDYGTRYARYGYLDEQRGLMSPRFGLNWTPVKNTKVSALITQRMVVPGAEEFMPRAITGPALPPERTFAPLGGDDFRVERARGLELALEHQFRDALVVGVRRFYQNVDDQMVTVFKLAPAGNPQSVGHYYVGTAGSFDASGWALRLSSPPALPVRGYVDYSVTRAQWSTVNERLGTVVPAALRNEDEIHDITTSVETEIPETATRFFVLYRVNSAFIRSSAPERPGLDGRFDLQVNQALPFGVAGTKWEVLVGLRNLFRDTADQASIYDELLVVRPPKRVIGGFLVRF
jgi:hypothetical protein